MVETIFMNSAYDQTVLPLWEGEGVPHSVDFVALETM
jgi:hypothetical protein